jgi:hypothetical protein
MSAVAPLLGTTPRTVKRFVNTYRLLKGRAIDPASFDRPRDGLGDHQVVAFLLAVVTGQPPLSSPLLRALARPDVFGTLEETVAALDLPSDPASSAVAQAGVENWMREQPHYARTPARRFSSWAVEVGRFSFTNPNTAVVPRDRVRSNGASISGPGVHGVPRR